MFCLKRNQKRNYILFAPSFFILFHACNFFMVTATKRLKRKADGVYTAI